MMDHQSRQGRRSPNAHRMVIHLCVVLIAISASCQAAAVTSPPGVVAPARTRTTTARSSSSSSSSLTAATASLAGPGERRIRGNVSKVAQQQNPSSAWIDGCKSALASALSAACVKTLLQPIDAVKTYQQYTHATSGASVSLHSSIRAIAGRDGGGSFGLGNFYAGLGVTVLGSMPGVSIYFGVYSYCKRRFLSTDLGRARPMLCVAMSAAIGNGVASFSRVPYEVVKQQLQTGVYSSTLEALSTILRSGPRRALGSVFPPGGIASQMWRDVPYAIATLLLYETLQAAVRKRYGTGTGGGNVSTRMSPRRRKALDFVVGGIAGGMGSWVTNPQDVIKTRLQTNSAAYGGSVAACAAALWREGGPSAFLRGSVPRLLHKVPANAFFFLFYEVFRRLLRVSDAQVAAGETASATKSNRARRT